MWDNVRKTLFKDSRVVANALVRAHTEAVKRLLAGEITVADAVPLCCTNPRGRELELRDAEFHGSQYFYEQCLKYLRPRSPKRTASSQCVTPDASMMQAQSKRSKVRRTLQPLRQSSRVPARASLPDVFAKLFWPTRLPDSNKQRIQRCKLHLELQCQTPRIWTIRDFLKPDELKHLQALAERSTFQRSFTQSADGKKIINEQRTSTFFVLPGNEDSIAKKIQMSASTIDG